MAPVHLYQLNLGRPGKIAVCPVNTTREHTTSEPAKVTCKSCLAWLRKRGVIR